MYGSIKPEDRDSDGNEADQEFSDCDDDLDEVGLDGEVQYDSTFASVCSFIIANEFCERLAFYGFQGSLVLFMKTKLGFSNAGAATQMSIWNGVCYLTPLLGGSVADVYTGRYKAILIFIVIYFVGMVGVCMCAYCARPPMLWFFIAIYVVALGTGGIKPNVSTFGADQFSRGKGKNAEMEEQEKASFFNWFYFSINMGAMISFTIVADLCQNVGFAAGYTVPVVFMGISIVFFVIGSSRYYKPPPQGSVMGQALKIILEAGWQRRNVKMHNERVRSSSSSETKKRSSHAAPSSGTEHLGWLARACIVEGGSFEKAKVTEVWLVLRLFPFLGLLVVYWGVYSQMSSLFFLQACQMDVRVWWKRGAHPYHIPIASLNVFDTLTVLVLIPLFDNCLYPWLRSKGFRLTMLAKIGCGFVLAAMSMLAAAILELERRRIALKAPMLDTPNLCSDADGPQVHNVANISVLWQIPQFVLIGASEVLSSVTAMEFFFSQAPSSMKSLGAALNLTTSAMGYWLIAFLVPLVNFLSAKYHLPWLPNDLNKGRADYYFLLLCGLMLVDSVFFVWQTQSYEYRQEDGSISTTYRSPNPRLRRKSRLMYTALQAGSLDSRAQNTPKRETRQQDKREHEDQEESALLASLPLATKEAEAEKYPEC